MDGGLLQSLPRRVVGIVLFFSPDVALSPLKPANQTLCCCTRPNICQMAFILLRGANALMTLPLLFLPQTAEPTAVGLGQNTLGKWSNMKIIYISTVGLRKVWGKSNISIRMNNIKEKEDG